MNENCKCSLDGYESPSPLFPVIFLSLLLFRPKYFTKFASLTVRRSQRGSVGGKQTYEKRLLDALSWLVETWKISFGVRNEADSRCLVE